MTDSISTVIMGNLVKNKKRNDLPEGKHSAILNLDAREEKLISEIIGSSGPQKGLSAGPGRPAGKAKMCSLEEFIFGKNNG